MSDDEREYDGEGDREENDHDDDLEEISGTEHTIFCIDARKPMHKCEAIGKNGEELSWFEASLRLVVKKMKQMAIAGNADTIGITFFGTVKSKVKNIIVGEVDGDEPAAGVYEFLPLDRPSAEAIIEARDLIEKLQANKFGYLDLPNTWDTDYGSLPADKPCPLKEALSICKDSFPAAARHRDTTRIHIFTNDDDPYSKDTAEAESAAQVAVDAMQGGANIELLPLRAGTPFDKDKFYNKIVSYDEDVDDAATAAGPPGGHTTMKDLFEDVERRQISKRRHARIPFIISEGGDGSGPVSFDVQVFNLVQPSKRPSSIQVSVRTNKPVKLVTRYIDGETGDTLDANDIRLWVPLGKERVYIHQDDFTIIKQAGDPSLTLLGFADALSLRDDYNMRSSYFIYPDEERVRDSARAFASLHKAMREKGKIALARFVRQRSATPVVVAMLPAVEKTMEDGRQQDPPGMHLVILPFASEVRELPAPLKPPAEADDAAVAAARQMVRAAPLENFDCRDFPNPALQKYYHKLHCLALSDSSRWNAAESDATLPATEALDERVGDAARALTDLTGLADEPHTGSRACKRRTGANGEGAPPKKAKPETDHTNVNWKNAVANNTLEGYSLATLKDCCRAHGLKVSGTKPVLADRIRKHFEAPADADAGIEEEG